MQEGREERQGYHGRYCVGFRYWGWVFVAGDVLLSSEVGAASSLGEAQDSTIQWSEKNIPTYAGSTYAVGLFVEHGIRTKRCGIQFMGCML